MRLFFGIALLLSLLATCVWSQEFSAPPESSLPQSPAEFHTQEWQRISGILYSTRPSPMTSTQADYDVTFYDLSLDLRAFAARTISGSVNVSARSLAPDLDQMILDLCSSLVVDTVRCNGIIRPFTLADTLLTISLDRTYAVGEMLTVRVVYHGAPCRSGVSNSLLFLSRAVVGGSIPTICTLSEPRQARDWWPCKDVVSDKADSARISLIVADTLTATSSGVLESVTALPPSSRIFTWMEHYPVSTYLICVNATNYVHFRDWYVTPEDDSVPIDNYSYPERLTRAQVDWSVLPAMMTFCAEKFGPYPFSREKYGHTMWAFYARAMEHQCATSYDRYLTDGLHTYDYVTLHELAHQWYGDDVTLATWPDVWLNEGFASYSEALWFEDQSGTAAYHEYMNNTSDLGVNDPSGPVCNPTDLFSANTVYHKGAWILHTLRGVVDNDSLFFAALAEYQHRHAYGNATTSEFLDDVSDVVGYNVTPYLFAWLYGVNRPRYAVSFGSGLLDGEAHTVVRIRQTQSDTPNLLFQTRLDLQLMAGTDSVRMRIDNSAHDSRYDFEPGFIPSQITLDPDDWVLKQVNFELLPLTILNSGLPDAQFDSSYAETLKTVGGTGNDFSWSVVEGTLPDGILLTSDGVLSGIPSVTGSFPMAVSVQNENRATDTMRFKLDVRTDLTSPARLTAYGISGGQILLRWNSVAAADSYRVYRAPDPALQNIEWIYTTTDTFCVDTAVTGLDSMNVCRFYEARAVRNP